MMSSPAEMTMTRLMADRVMITSKATKAMTPLMVAQVRTLSKAAPEMMRSKAEVTTIFSMAAMVATPLQEVPATMSLMAVTVMMLLLAAIKL